MSPVQVPGDLLSDPGDVKLVPLDIAPYRQGNTAIPFVTRFDSGHPGPHAMICALMHGNEISGAIALDHVFRNNVRPTHGVLTLAFANTAAYGLFDPAKPHASRYVDEDMNRVWNSENLTGPRRSLEILRARALQPVIDTVDVLLDLHSMQSGTQPLHLCGPSEKGRQLARAVGGTATIVADVGHADGVRLRDYGRFNTPGTAQNALLAECGAHWDQATARTAIETVYRFLLSLGMVTTDLAAPYLTEAPRPAFWIEVTDRFIPDHPDATFVENFTGLECIPSAGTTIATDGNRDIITPYDDCVLIMPAHHLAKGQTAVRLGKRHFFEDREDVRDH